MLIEETSSEVKRKRYKLCLSELFFKGGRLIIISRIDIL